MRRRVQRWTLMPYAVVTGCIHPVAILRCVRTFWPAGTRSLTRDAAADARRSAFSPASATSTASPRGWCAPKCATAVIYVHDSPPATRRPGQEFDAGQAEAPSVGAAVACAALWHMHCQPVRSPAAIRARAKALTDARPAGLRCARSTCRPCGSRSPHPCGALPTAAARRTASRK